MKMLRQDILAMYGVPESLIFPSATNSNTEESTKNFMRFTIKPALRAEEGTLNEQLLPKYYIGQRGAQISQYYFEFDDVISTDKKMLAEVAQIGLQSGAITRNEARLELGLEKDPQGDVYLVNPAPVTPTVSASNQTTDPALADQVKQIKDNIKVLEDLANKSFQDDMHQSAILESQLIEQKAAYDDSVELENRLKPVIIKGFEAQAVRIINKYTNRKPTLRGAFNVSEENAAMVSIIQHPYDQIASTIANDINIEIKQKLYRNNNKNFLVYKDKSLSENTMNHLQTRVDYFSDIINKTTRDDLKALIAESIQAGADSQTLQTQIANLFNGYIEGVGNIDTLKSLNVYEELITISANGTATVNQASRYNTMMKSITEKLSGEDQQKALAALRGILDLSEPTGKLLASLLDTVYQVNKTEVITDYRAGSIARTESTALRGFVQKEQYDSNEFVKGNKWVSALQPGITRDAHFDAYGQIAPKGKAFIVGGEEMLHPGDSSLGASAENIVNCRCRLSAVVE
jgi:hypothetical protein